MSPSSPMQPDYEPAAETVPRSSPSSGLPLNIIKRPLVLVALSLVAGIVWADWAAPDPVSVALLAAIAVGCVVLDVLLDLPAGHLFLWLASALVGASLHAYRIQPGPDDPMRLAECGPVTLIGSVSRIPASDDFHQRVELDVHSARGDTAEIPVRGKLLCNLPPEPAVSPGETLQLNEVVVWAPTAITGPGQFDEKRALARRGIHAIGKAEEVAVVIPQPLWRAEMDVAVARVRAHVVSVLRAAMPGPDANLYADLLASMVFGMYNVRLPDSIVEDFRRSGTVHLMVVSGAQVTILAAAIIFLFQGVRVRPPLWIILVVIPPLLLYALVAGPYASVMRSLAMAVLLLVSMVSGHRYDFWTALSIAAICLCVADSSAPFSVSVQLTFAAVIGTVAFWPRGLRGGYGWRSRARAHLLRLAGATLGAWLMTAPIIAYYFSTLVVAGIVANLVAIPLSVVLLGTGFASVLLGSVWLPLAVLPCALSRALLYVMLWAIHGFAAVPGAAVGNLHMPIAAVLAWYVAAGVVWWLLYGETRRVSEAGRQSQRSQWGPAVVVALGGLIFLVVAVSASPRQLVRVTFLAVGQGQCTIISDTAGHQIVFDAGTGPSSPRAYQQVGRRVILPYLAHRGIRRLNALIMSHGDTDHCSGMADVMRGVEVGRFATNGLPVAGQPSAVRAIDTARRLGIPHEVLRAGCRIELADGAELAVLGPSHIAHGDTSEDINNNSIAMRLSYRNVSILLPADLAAEGEAALVKWAWANGVPIQSSVLILSHHGRKGSSTPGFLDAVNPRLAIVNGAALRYRPAHPEVLSRLRARGIPLLSTDIVGTVELATDGRRLWISAFGGRYSRSRDARWWQATTSARNSSAAGQAAALTPRCNEMVRVRRVASWSRTSCGSSSLRSRNARAASASCSGSRRMLDISASLTDASESGAFCCSEVATVSGTSRLRSFTTTVPAA